MSAPIKIDFCDFWPGFPKTANFFYWTLKPHFNLELCDQPDFLIFANPEGHMHRLHSCIKIYFGVESFLPDWSQCDYAMTCHYLEDARHLRLPYYAIGGGPERLDKSKDNPEKILAAKTRFCGFVVSNAGKRRTQKRVDFFRQLSRYKRVDSAGRALNNIGGPLADGWEHKLEFLRTCKFNIAFENASVPGYTTEKIVDAFWARALPIYWGNPRIDEEFNSASFLNYFDFPNEEALIERIIELDKDDAKYLGVMRQPFFPKNQPTEAYSRERFLAFFEKIFKSETRPAQRPKPFVQLGRWLLVKQNKPSRSAKP
jgi:hypothetical protein